MWANESFYSGAVSRRCSVKKVFFRNFSKFKGATLLKKRAQVFSCEFCEISKNRFSAEHLWMTASVSVWLLPISLDVYWLRKKTS